MNYSHSEGSSRELRFLVYDAAAEGALPAEHLIGYASIKAFELVSLSGST